ncbi:alpha/beta hydrolase [Fontivita pretiosa]|uniref:alpha/beta hydrolase n=1 Tax=Fontivita pretiosa TaxID=2989684 RepID=UPI003D17250F
MMYLALHWLLVAGYVAAPPLAATLAFVHSLRRASSAAMIPFLLTVLSGTLIGTTFVTLHSLRSDARTTWAQFALAIYFGTSMLLLLKALDLLLGWLLRLTLPARESGTSVMVPTQPDEPAFKPSARPTADALRATRGFMLRGLIRGLILIVVGLPFVASALLTYRPRLMPPARSSAELQDKTPPVVFDSLDGVRISAWWLQADPSRHHAAADTTVLFCHGLGEDKSQFLKLAGKLAGQGYNGLLIDLRAHGQSGGLLTSFGALERRDVLAAIRWLRANRPRQAIRIVGVGSDIGAAALIAAAADDSPEGQALNALAVFGAFDDLNLLARDLARSMFVPPVDRLVAALGVPFASMHCGANLSAFRPVELVRDLWPRPILIIHASHDQLVRLERGQALFDAASFPRQALWLSMIGRKGALSDEDVIDALREFLRTARPMSVI